MSQREKKWAFARGTDIQNLFDVLADKDNDDHDDDDDEFTTKPTKCGSQSKTADGTTSYNKPEVYVNINSDRDVHSLVLPVKVASHRKPIASSLRVLPVRRKGSRSLTVGEGRPAMGA